jgi:hypothetical protein
MPRLLICAFLCLLFYTSAKADTFTLTSGSLSVGLNEVSLVASGANISIGIAVAPGFGVDLTNVICQPAPCQPGSALHIGGFGALLGDNNFPGVATIDGVTFNGLDLAVFLQSTSLTVLPPNFSSNDTVKLPFSMEGTVTGFERCPQDPLNPGCRVQVFSITVNGSGIVTADAVAQPHPRVVYNFQPVPEPAALGLFGIGLLAATGFYRSRVKRR